jgi:hypothetical protein
MVGRGAHQVRALDGVACAAAGPAVDRLSAQRPRHDGGRRIFTPRTGQISDRSAGELEPGGARYSSGCIHDVPPIPTSERSHPLMVRSRPHSSPYRMGFPPVTAIVAPDT